MFPQTRDLNLELDPEEIKTLAEKINEAVSQLENVESIIDETRYDLNKVDNLKNSAEDAK